MLQNSLPPLGILSIAAYLESKGQAVGVYDVHGEKLDDVAVRERLRRDRPRFVGISVLTNMSIPAHKIARICKEELPDTLVVVGGVHAEALPESMLRNSAIDLVVRGDGEVAMSEIVSGRPWTEIEGLSFRQEGQVIHNPPRKLVMDLDTYPLPAYHLVDFKNYFPAVGSYRNLPAINMLMTRGCPGACTFCNSARTTLRSRNPANVVEQIKMLNKKYGIRQIQFYDDTFTVMKREVLDFCRLLEAAHLDISWIAYIRGDCFSDAMAAAMRRAGCHQVLMGVETGNAEVAERMGKPIRLERYREAVAIAHRHGLEVRGSFIIGSMGETWQSMMDTLNFAMEIDVDLFQLNVSTPFPGTVLFKECVERGLLKHRNWYRYGQGEVLYEQPQLSAAEILRFEKYAFRRFYLRPKVAWRMLKRAANVQILKDYFFAFSILLLGKHKKNTSHDWSCWSGLSEAEFQDVALSEPDRLRLTYQLRQIPEFS
ncbi:MAG: radical SAM protein [Magnetococcales bacterium]|nr:radical SAM protein [Magnetococcales bacterium]